MEQRNFQISLPFEGRFSLLKAKDLFECEIIKAALDLHDGVAADAARSLNVHRSTLVYLCRKYDVPFKRRRG